MKKHKKLFAVLTLMCFMFTLLPMSAFAETEPVTSGKCGENVAWEFDAETGILTISGSGEISSKQWNSYDEQIIKLVIKEGITTIGSYAFAYSNNLETVEFPGSLVNIEEWAFSGCDSLVEVTLLENVQNIDSYAFSSCRNLESAFFSEGLQTIGDNAFSYCWELASIQFPDSLVTIGEKAFYGCRGLETITIPKNVTNIGQQAFGGYTSLKKFNVVKENTNYFSDVVGVLFERANEGIALNTYPSNNSTKAYTVSEGTKIIRKHAFTDAYNLEKIDLKDGLLEIEGQAFNECRNLHIISLPSTIQSIRPDAFNECNNITDVYYDGTEEEWQAVEIGAGNDEILSSTIHYESDYEIVTNGECGENTTWDFDIETNTLTFSGTGAIDSYVVYGNDGLVDEDLRPWKDYDEQIRKVVVEEGVTIIGRATLLHCENVDKIIVASTVTSLSGLLEEISYRYDKVKTAGPIDGGYDIEFAWTKDIPECAFSGCNSLESVVIPEGIKEIKKATFNFCENLKTVKLPESLESIGIMAFSYCYDLTEINITEGLKTIGNCAFVDCKSLEILTLPDTLEDIGVETFRGCSSLKTINIPDGITKIEGVFDDCSSLESIIIPASVETVSRNAFSGCKSLESLILLGEKTVISGNVFGGTGNKLNTAGPIGGDYDYQFSWKTEIPNGAFHGGPLGIFVESLVIPEGIKVIGEMAFRWNESIAVLELPKSLEKICKQSFEDCNLEIISIPKNVKEIGENAFKNCEKLNTITFEGSAPDMSYNCFSGVTATAYYTPGETWTDEVKGNYGGDITWVASTPVVSKVTTQATANGKVLTLNENSGYDIEVVSGSGGTKVVVVLSGEDGELFGCNVEYHSTDAIDVESDYTEVGELGEVVFTILDTGVLGAQQVILEVQDFYYLKFNINVLSKDDIDDVTVYDFGPVWVEDIDVYMDDVNKSLAHVFLFTPRDSNENIILTNTDNGLKKATTSATIPENYDYVSVEKQPEGSNLKNQDLSLVYVHKGEFNAPSDGWTIKLNNGVKFDVEGYYFFNVMLDNGKRSGVGMVVVEKEETTDKPSDDSIGGNTGDSSGTGSGNAGGVGGSTGGAIGGGSSSGSSGGGGGGAISSKPVEITSPDDSIKLSKEQVDVEVWGAAASALSNDENAKVIISTNSSTSISAKDENGQDVVSFAKPIKVTVPIGADVLKSAEDKSKLTLALVTTDEKGNTTLEYVGGIYDSKADSFTAYTDKPGDYVLVEKSDIVKMDMFIDNKDSIINNTTATNDVAPFILNNRTMVPVAFIMNNMGCKVDWFGDERKVVITLPDGKQLSMIIDQEIPGFGGIPIIKNDRTMVPIAYIADAMGAKVMWIEDERRVVIVK